MAHVAARIPPALSALDALGLGVAKSMTAQADRLAAAMFRRNLVPSALPVMAG
jgi:hypothetical protein